MIQLTFRYSLALAAITFDSEVCIHTLFTKKILMGLHIHSGQVKGDGRPSCFSNIQDTGIPDLQRWCHELTIASRERSARSFLTQIQLFCQTVKNYVQGIGDVTLNDREALRAKWESRETNEATRYDQASNLSPLDSILNGLGAGLGSGLFTMNQDQPVKTDIEVELHGITHLLCTVGVLLFMTLYIVRYPCSH